jgi:copper(I)-binding protein
MKAVLAAAALFAAAAAPAVAATPALLQAVQPWSRPAAAGGNGAGYLTLVNRGKTADALVGVESPAAQKVEMHASSMAGGVMKMSQEARVPLPAGGQVVFAPGGRHLMLIGLKKPLKTGDKVPATLRFASGQQLKVDFAVSATAPAGAAQGHGTHDMQHMH